MTVFQYTLKRLVNNKIRFIMLLVLSLIAIVPAAIIASSDSSSNMKITVGIADNDQTSSTEVLTNRLMKSFNIITIEEPEIETYLTTSKIDYALVFAKDLSTDMPNPQGTIIEGYGLKGKDYSAVVNGVVNDFVDGVVTPAKVVHKKDYSTTWALIIQFLLISAILTSVELLNDKENKTFYRSLNTPITIKSYMFQSILSFFAVALIQIAVFFTVTVYIFGNSPGKSNISMLLLLVIIALVGVSMGTALSSVCNSSVQAIASGVGFIMIMCMLGGAWGGIKPDNSLVINITKAMPFYWAMDGIQKLLADKPLKEIYQNLFILLSFATIFFLAGTWRKTDIVK